MSIAKPHSRKFLLLLLGGYLAACGPTPDEQARALIVEAVQTYEATQGPEIEKLKALVAALDNLLEEYPATLVAQNLVRGETVALGKTYDELKAELSSETHALDYSKFFSRLVVQFCLENDGDVESIRSELESDQSFRPVKDLEGGYETHHGNVSFAVTVDSEVCTVDVQLKNEYHNVLFEVQHIDGQINNITHSADSTFVEDVDFGPEDNEVKVLRKTYHTEDGRKVVLVYPVTDLESFYMYVDSYWNDKI